MNSTDIYLYIVRSDRPGIALVNTHGNDSLRVAGSTVGRVGDDSEVIHRELLAAGWEDTGSSWRSNTPDGAACVVGWAVRITTEGSP